MASMGKILNLIYETTVFISYRMRAEKMSERCETTVLSQHERMNDLKAVCIYIDPLGTGAAALYASTRLQQDPRSDVRLTLT